MTYAQDHESRFVTYFFISVSANKSLHVQAKWQMEK